MRSLVTSISLYVCESWTLTAELQRRIQAMEMRCYCKILCISYKDHVINEEVCAKIQQAIGPHGDLLTIVKRCTVKGGRREGRQRKRWEDNRKWTGLEFTKFKWAVETREKWRKLVAKSSVVPQWPSRLRDRWWWWSCSLVGLSNGYGALLMQVHLPSVANYFSPRINFHNRLSYHVLTASVCNGMQ